jgi:hypothetical protein
MAVLSRTGDRKKFDSDRREDFRRFSLLSVPWRDARL